MKPKKTFLTFLVAIATALVICATPREIVVHTGGGNNGNNQLYLLPPVITYDEDLNELYVMFGTNGTIDIDYVDPAGIPYNYVYGEYHAAYADVTYTCLPTGYYTITIHSVYGVTYYGNFTVS